MSKMIIGKLKSIQCIALAVVMVVGSSQAGIIANWDFEDIPAGSEYGTVAIVATTSTVNNVIATEVNSTHPLYVRGADGVGHAAASGILGVAAGMATESLFSGWTEFNISFDARLSSVPTATQAIMRYGVTTTAWNLYVTSDGRLNMMWLDTEGGSFTLNTTAAAFYGDSQFHHYDVIWDGTNAQILVDGSAQLVEDGSSTTATVSLGTIRSAGAAGNFALGGMWRDDMTSGQEFGGFLDNIIISNTAVTSKVARVSLVVIGF